MIIAQKRIAFLRFLAFGIDWLIIMVWAAILFGIVMLSSSGHPQAPSGPWMGQVIGFFSMTLPVLLYFSICEASVWQATIGKRILSLKVVGSSKDRLPFSRTLLRNIIKFAPWELGHLVAQQAFFSASSTIPDWVLAPMFLSFLLPLWWLISIYVKGDSPYDHILNIRVTLNDEAS